MMMLPAGREMPLLTELFRVLWFVAKNSVARGEKLHVNCLYITFSGDMKVVNALSVQESQSSLIVLRTDHRSPSHMIKLCTCTVK
jgi:hypothetical protein